MTKKMRKAIHELLFAASKFMPSDATIHAFDELANEDGKPRKYGYTCNLEDWYTDRDATRLRNAVDEVKKLLGDHR